MRGHKHIKIILKSLFLTLSFSLLTLSLTIFLSSVSIYIKHRHTYHIPFRIMFHIFLFAGETITSCVVGISEVVHKAHILTLYLINNMFIINYLIAIICKTAFISIEDYIRFLYKSMNDKQKIFLLDALKCDNIDTCGSNIGVFARAVKKYIIGGCVTVIIMLSIKMCVLMVLKIDRKKKRYIER